MVAKTENGDGSLKMIKRENCHTINDTVDHGTSPRFWSELHAIFRVGSSWAAKALGVKFPSAECGRFSL